MRVQAFFERAQRLWQPMLAKTLRDVFVVGKFGERYRERLTKQQMLEMMRATHISVSLHYPVIAKIACAIRLIVVWFHGHGLCRVLMSTR